MKKLKILSNLILILFLFTSSNLFGIEKDLPLKTVPTNCNVIDCIGSNIMRDMTVIITATTIEGVTEGVYSLKAYKTGTEILVFYGQVDAFLGGEYNWDIEGPCEIIVTNNYGETLQIHMNGTYLGDLDDSYSETISKVTFGEHALEAKKPNSYLKN